ncbi:hypothetical protein IJJ12_00720 [bacterium]|nr:hypothetical protein [bacterium]
MIKIVQNYRDFLAALFTRRTRTFPPIPRPYSIPPTRKFQPLPTGPSLTTLFLTIWGVWQISLSTINYYQARASLWRHPEAHLSSTSPLLQAIAAASQASPAASLP